LRMRAAELHREPVTRVDARIIDGIRYVLRRGDLLLPTGLALVVGMVGFNFQLTLPVLAKVVFTVDPTMFGLLVAALGLGSLAGAMAGSTRRSRPSAFLVIGAATVFGLLEIIVAFG